MLMSNNSKLCILGFLNDAASESAGMYQFQSTINGPICPWGFSFSRISPSPQSWLPDVQTLAHHRHHHPTILTVTNMLQALAATSTEPALARHPDQSPHSPIFHQHFRFETITACNQFCHYQFVDLLIAFYLFFN